MRFARQILGLVLTWALIACGEGPVPTQEWTPADHTQPPDQQRDPRRVPRQTQVREETSEDPIARAAAALWNVTCAACHGRNGQGDGPQATEPLADFTDPEWQAATTDETIAQVIMEGRGTMPAFQQIAPQGITALTAHIRRMNRDAPQAAPQQQPRPPQRPQGPQGLPPQGPLPPGHP